MLRLRSGHGRLRRSVHQRGGDMVTVIGDALTEGGNVIEDEAVLYSTFIALQAVDMIIFHLLAQGFDLIVERMYLLSLIQVILCESVRCKGRFLADKVKQPA